MTVPYTTPDKNCDKPRRPNARKPGPEWQEQEDYLEESLEETFPGSDPIAPGHPRKTGFANYE